MQIGTRAALIYHSPVYIHSHAQNLKTLQPIGEELVAKAKNRVKIKLDDIYSYLVAVSDNETLVNFYNDTHLSDGTRKMSANAQIVVDKMRLLREQLAFLKNDQGKLLESSKFRSDYMLDLFMQAIEKDATTTITDVIGEEEANNLVNFLKAEALKEGRTKKYSQLTSESSLKDLIRMRKGEITKTLQAEITKYFNTQNKNAEDVIAITTEFNKAVDEYIKSFSDVNQIMNTNDIARLTDTIAKFNSHKVAKYAISGTGFNFEKIFNFLALEEILQNGQVIINGETFNFSGYSTATGGHGVTTDNVIEFIDKNNEKIAAGFSLKNTFDTKTKNFNTTFRKEASANLSTLMSELEINTLLYYLANAKALSIFAAPEYYPTVLRGENFEVHLPDNVARSIDYNNVIKDIQMSYAYLVTIKAMLGSIFLDNNVAEKILKNNFVPPVFLSFATKDYWTYKIIGALLKEFNTDFAGFSNYISFKNQQSIDSLFSKITKESLEQLFVIKKMIESTSDNRYFDLLNNNIDPLYASRYAESTNIDTVLSVIVGNFNKSTLRQVLFGNVNINIPINDFIGVK